jgi:hypothetical protein
VVGGGGGGHHPSAAAAPPPQKPQEPSAESTLVLTKTYSSGVDLPPMPTAAGDLRETFDLPLMREAAHAATNGSTSSRGRDAADALTLFDDRPAAPRRKVGAEARSNARRCPTCGGVIPVGMSLCQTCGLDLDTGARVSLMDDLAPPAPPRQEGIPAAIAIVGFLCLALSGGATLLALIKWLGGTTGAQYFIPVAGFGIYASIQFLRCKTAKILLVALTLGAAIDLAGLVGLPIYNAMNEVTVEQRPASSEDPEAPTEVIRPPAERLNLDQLWMGIAVLLVYAAMSIYILSPTVQRHFRC